MQVFLSLSIKYELAGYIPLVERLARFLPYCGLSYLGLITGSDVEAITNIVAEGQFSEMTRLYPFPVVPEKYIT